jgi:hypothetical protein
LIQFHLSKEPPDLHFTFNECSSVSFFRLHAAENGLYICFLARWYFRCAKISVKSKPKIPYQHYVRPPLKAYP